MIKILKHIFQELFAPKDNFWKRPALQSRFMPTYTYPYALFCKKYEAEMSKIFYHKSKAWSDLFQVFNDAPALLKGRSYKLPIALGREDDGKMLIKDLLAFPHLLISGQTGSGKSTLLYNMLLSLLFFTHPEYAKIIVLDKKVISFAALDNVVNVEGDTLAIAKVLQMLCDEVDARHEYIRRKTDSIKSHNTEVYIQRNRNSLKPYIVVVLEEFAELKDDVNELLSTLKADKEHAKDRKKDIRLLECAMNNVSKLARLSRSAGFCLIFCTQYPTKDAISTSAKANLVDRISLMVSNHTQASVALGSIDRSKVEKKFLPDFFNKAGESVLKSKNRLTKFQSFRTDFAALKMAAQQLERHRFDFRFYHKLQKQEA